MNINPNILSQINKLNSVAHKKIINNDQVLHYCKVELMLKKINQTQMFIAVFFIIATS